jgi:transcription elongation factor Elf1
VAEITRERAERIARSHACEQCREYSYKRVTVKPASAEHKAELDEMWHVVAHCGICGAEIEMGIDEDGNVIYAG